eukprot:CAMPEP_0202897658 /NCGR_PEP_ID=MMETSP1392-20130828/6359_1 /ASSEMBLY_ACC=CAM_ASM_000868 /TAXON_ID=225041 /ORGANISM="Chlamydomonas chlamydogama, Strain SAG 11-48b" /LENGTH=133 /DNA_ID=CAMNT_0049583349 /DNA_START=203 /DNA_END=604 /DNA_ORIENTATION=-
MAGVELLTRSYEKLVTALGDVLDTSYSASRGDPVDKLRSAQRDLVSQCDALILELSSAATALQQQQQQQQQQQAAAGASADASASGAGAGAAGGEVGHVPGAGAHGAAATASQLTDFATALRAHLTGSSPAAP